MQYNQIGFFFPSKEMTLEQQLNALMRFSVYFAFAMMALKSNVNFIYIVVIVGLVTFMIFEAEQRQKGAKSSLFKAINVAENGDNKKKHVFKPTKDNPFMNVTVGDYSRFPNRPPAGDWSDPKVRNAVKENFENGLMRGNDDIFNKNASDRQYYTMPCTTIPNDQHTFAEWLYHKPAQTYKEHGLHIHKA